jgi:hypothetical protein
MPKEAQVATAKTRPKEPVDHIHAQARENARRQAEGNGDAPEHAEAPKTEPLLKLKTALEPRPTVEVDGSNYELRHRREFSIIEQHQLQVEGDEFDELFSKKEALNSKQRQRLKVVLDSMFNKVLMAPEDVKKLLDDESRRAVVLTFTRAPLLMAEIADIREDEDEDETPISDT